jgi:hypothetical protein
MTKNPKKILLTVLLAFSMLIAQAALFGAATQAATPTAGTYLVFAQGSATTNAQGTATTIDLQGTGFTPSSAVRIVFNSLYNSSSITVPPAGDPNTIQVTTTADTSGHIGAVTTAATVPSPLTGAGSGISASGVTATGLGAGGVGFTGDLAAAGLAVTGVVGAAGATAGTLTLSAPATITSGSLSTGTATAGTATAGTVVAGSISTGTVGSTALSGGTITSPTGTPSLLTASTGLTGPVSGGTITTGTGGLTAGTLTGVTIPAAGCTAAAPCSFTGAGLTGGSATGATIAGSTLSTGTLTGAAFSAVTVVGGTSGAAGTGPIALTIPATMAAGTYAIEAIDASGLTSAPLYYTITGPTLTMSVLGAYTETPLTGSNTPTAPIPSIPLGGTMLIQATGLTAGTAVSFDLVPLGFTTAPPPPASAIPLNVLTCPANPAPTATSCVVSSNGAAVATVQIAKPAGTAGSAGPALAAPAGGVLAGQTWAVVATYAGGSEEAGIHIDNTLATLTPSSTLVAAGRR